MNGTDIVLAARDWLGTPFKHQGRIKGKGVDCIGLIAGVSRELELLPSSVIDGFEEQYRGYSREPSHGTLDHVMRFLFEAPSNGANDGDIILMRFVKEPQHVGIYSRQDSTIIHSYQSVGKCVEHRLDDKWKRRIVSIHRFRGLN